MISCIIAGNSKQKQKYEREKINVHQQRDSPEGLRESGTGYRQDACRHALVSHEGGDKPGYGDQACAEKRS